LQKNLPNLHFDKWQIFNKCEGPDFLEENLKLNGSFLDQKIGLKRVHVTEDATKRVINTEKG
jgi:hypothetical protein